MFCSWRKSPSAPCGCAFRLRGPAKELLNRLHGLGEGTLVLRQQGISLAKKTPMGLCVAYGDGGWDVLRDRLSGLEMDTGRTQEFHLLAGAAERRPLLGVSEPGKPMHLSFRLDGLEWEHPAVQRLIVEFEGVALDCLQSRRLGAGAWLDEWARPVAEEDWEERMRQVRARLAGCRRLEVEARAAGSRHRMGFEPFFIDLSDGVLRVADRSLRHVVYADVADPACRMERAAGGRCELSRTEGLFLVANENQSR
jgi:hypothetical protein